MKSFMKSAALKRFAALITLFAVIATPSMVAHADTMSDAQKQMDDMTLRYGSLSGAMLQSYAVRQGSSLKSFLIAKPGTLANLSGANAASVDALVAQLGPNATSADLDAVLSSNGLAFGSSAYQSVSAAALAVKAQAGSYDAAVVQAGMTWANALVSLHAPALVTPSSPQLDASQVTGMPAEGLAFGMFTNRALNAFIRSYPDVFSQVAASGVGTPAQMKDWNKSMSAAMAASKPDLNNMLGSSCAGAFLDGLTGKASSGPCSPCSAAGLLANGQLQLIFDPTAGSTIPDGSNAGVSASEWQNMTPSQRQIVLQQNPSLAGALTKASSGAGSNCSAAGGAVAGNVATVLPGVLDYLNKP